MQYFNKHDVFPFMFLLIATKRLNSSFFDVCSQNQLKQFGWHTMHSTELLCFNGKWKHLANKRTEHFPFERRIRALPTQWNMFGEWKAENCFHVPKIRIRIEIGLHAIVVQASVQLIQSVFSTSTTITHIIALLRPRACHYV